MRMYVVMAVRNLLQARRRTVWMSVALGFVALMLVILLTLAEGLADTMARASTLLVAGHVNVAGFFKVRSTSMTPLVTHARSLRQEVQRQVPEADYIIDRGRGWAKVVSESQSLQAVLAGIEVAQEGRLLQHLRPAEPKSYGAEPSSPRGDPRDMAQPQGVILFAGQARRLRVGVGDAVTFTAELPGGQTNTANGKVVFVAQDLGFLSNFNVFVTKQLIWELGHFSHDTTGAVMVYLHDPNKAEAVMARLHAALGRSGYRMMDHVDQPFFTKFETVASEDWTGQKIDLTTWEDELGVLRWSLNALRSISSVLLGILLVMIVVGVSNSMVIAVRERTQEIGTLRAMGMGRRQVVLLFLMEAATLGLVATSCGAALGVGLALAVDAAALPVGIEALRAVLMSDVFHLSVRVGQVLAAVATLSGVTCAAALWPALRAARLQPTTAINKVG